MKPILLLLILLVFSCKQAPTDSTQNTTATTPDPSEATMEADPAADVAKMVSGKTWQSQANPDITMEIRDGRMITMLKGAARSESPFVTFSKSCPGGKAEGEGMNAGFICCMTLATKLEAHYLVLTADAETFEYIEDKNPDAKAEVFKLLKTE